LLTATDARNFTNESSASIVLGMTCLNGYFHGAHGASLAEALLMTERGGAVAVWASSGMTGLPVQKVLSREFFRLFSESEALTIGEAVMQAKSVVRNRDVCLTWLLLGDPLTPLAR
jgi:hypothetical protein